MPDHVVTSLLSLATVGTVWLSQQFWKEFGRLKAIEKKYEAIKLKELTDQQLEAMWERKFNTKIEPPSIPPDSSP